MLPICALASPQAGKESNQKNETMAAEAFQAGQALYENGEYLEAAHEFEKAYRLAPHPSVLANIGYCYNKIGDYPKAVEAFQKYLESPNPDKTKSNEKIEKYLEEIKPKVGELRVDCVPARCEVTVDGRSRGMAPISIVLRAGAHAVDIVPFDGGPKKHFDVKVPGGGELVLDVDLPVSRPLPVESVTSAQAAQTEPIAHRNRGTHLKAPFWVATGATIAGVGATAVLIGVGHKTREDFFAGGSTDEALKQRGENLVVGINIAAGLTAAAATTAVILYFVDSRRKRKDDARGSGTVGRRETFHLRFSAGLFTGLHVDF